MHEDLLNAVSNLVHRHVLRELHDMTGALLAQLDAGGEVDLGWKAPTPEPTKPAVAAPSPKPERTARKQRLVRAKQRRQAANGAATPVTAPAGPWPVVRDEFHAAIKTRHLSRAKVAADLGVSKGSICGWLVPHGAPPSAANISKIQRWLSSAPKPVLREGAEVPVTATADAPLYELTPAERDHLAGHLSLAGNARELRDEFGCTRELLEQAASGAHLHADVISRVRGVLANGAAG